jgi:hypothetical protein
VTGVQTCALPDLMDKADGVSIGLTFGAS